MRNASPVHGIRPVTTYPRQRTKENLMAKRASEWIPENILAAAQKAGLSVPLWYVGRNNGHEHHGRKKTFEDLVADAGEKDPAPVPTATKRAT